MIVSSDLIARDPRVSSRFNFSEKRTHSPRFFRRAGLRIMRQRAAFTATGAGARSFSDSIRDGDPGSLTLFNRGTFASPGKQTSSGKRLERCRNRAILRQPPLFLLRSSARKRNRHRRASQNRSDHPGDRSLLSLFISDASNFLITPFPF